MRKEYEDVQAGRRKEGYTRQHIVELRDYWLCLIGAQCNEVLGKAARRQGGIYNHASEVCVAFMIVKVCKDLPNL